MNEDKEFQERLLSIFKLEAEEYITSFNKALLKLEKNLSPNESEEIIEKILRDLHSLKGASRAVNNTEIVALCQTLENVFIYINGKKDSINSKFIDKIFLSIDFIENTINNKPRTFIHDIIKELEKIQTNINDNNIEKKENLPDKTKEDKLIEIENKTEINTYSIKTDENNIDNSIDLTTRIPVSKLNSILSMSEDLLTSKLSYEQNILLLKEILLNISELDNKNEKLLYDFRSIYNDLNKVNNNKIFKFAEDFKNNNNELKLLKNNLQKFVFISELESQNLTEITNIFLNEIKNIIMFPFDTILETFPRMIRTISKQQNKEINFEVKGGKLEVDKRILDDVKSPLIHIIRNSIDHGIETVEKRKEKGKIPNGNIKINIYKKSETFVEIEIIDDGNGINTEKLKNIAIKNGVYKQEEIDALSNENLLETIFKSGITTSEIVTDMSGRGLGLSIVHDTIKKIGGSIQISSVQNKGTIFNITIPLSISTSRGVIIKTSNSHFIIPTQNVIKTLRIPVTDISNLKGKKVIHFEDKIINVVDLSTFFNLDINENLLDDNFNNIIIIHENNNLLALNVDKIINEQEIIVKNLGKQLQKVKNISGLGLLGSGKLYPIINIYDLFESYKNNVEKINLIKRKSKKVIKKKKILIAEDSITSRTLLQSILENNGYLVKTTVNGAEALNKLIEEDFELVISDVEMPIMNGFELTEKIRNNNKLSEIPVILVTSLSKKEDREKGIDIGANAYIIKSLFDQSNLLDVISRLI